MPMITKLNMKNKKEIKWIKDNKHYINIDGIVYVKVDDILKDLNEIKIPCQHNQVVTGHGHGDGCLECQEEIA